MEAEKAVQREDYLDENGNPKPIVLGYRGNLSPMSDISGAVRVADRESRITDEVEHYALKHDRVHDVWSNWGSR